MRFTKMHGTGNDYVYVNTFEQPPPADIPELTIAMSDRHTGVGADGLILVGPSDSADARMIMHNADGSRAEMCGNGLRCVAKLVYESGIARREEFSIETDAGIKTVRVFVEDGRVTRARVNMGRPVLQAEAIPTTIPGHPPRRPYPLATGDDTEMVCISMGNPHAVLFVDRLDDSLVCELGPQIEVSPEFPARTNVEFVSVISKSEIHMRVWERGAGETLACGTGACAAVVAGAITQRTDRAAVCRLPGGDLEIEWAETGDVFLTGNAIEVFQGEWLP